MTGPGKLPPGAPETQRLDKWLWYARLAKSRTLAASLVTGGKIRVNRSKVDKASHGIRVGDVITSGARREVRILRVRVLGVRRGPAAEAASLYEDLSPKVEVSQGNSQSPAGRGEVAGRTGEASRAAGERARGAGRPTKRERRQIDRLTEWSD